VIDPFLKLHLKNKTAFGLYANPAVSPLLYVGTELLEQKLSSKCYSRRLAEAKAQALAAAHILATTDDTNNTVASFYLGSDTIVELDEFILEKPKDREDAKRMLKMMSGRQHHVHTGVALYRLFQNQVTLIDSFTDTATVSWIRLPCGSDSAQSSCTWCIVILWSSGNVLQNYRRRYRCLHCLW
jgi:hypothetical protein